MAKRPDIREVLNSLSKEELMGIIVDLTLKDFLLEESLIVRYSKGNPAQEREQCRKLIASIVKKHMGREGYISYRGTFEFTRDMGDLLEKVSSTEDVLLALDIAFLVLEEAVAAFQYADDSDGDIGSLIEDTLEQIMRTVTDRDTLDVHVKEEIFNRLLAESESDIFDGWEEYQILLLKICATFADVAVLRGKLATKLQELIDKNAGNKPKRHTHEQLFQILFGLIKGYGTEEEAEQFIQAQLHFTFFRAQAIEQYSKEKDYHKVIQLAMDGEQQDKLYAGLVSKWRKVRYAAYKELSLKEEQSQLAKELLFDGDFEYYRELETLSTVDKEVFYPSLKNEMKRMEGWEIQRMFLKLIVEENDVDEIMEVVRKSPGSIEQYAARLADKFRDEVIGIYKQHIRTAASSTANRKDYQRVCDILRRYTTIAGKKSQEELIEELRSLYGKRPAFVDELRKLK